MRYIPSQSFQGFSSLRLPVVALLILASLVVLRSPIEAHSQGPQGTFSQNWAPVECSEFKLKDLPEGIDCGYVTVPLRCVDTSPARAVRRVDGDRNVHERRVRRA